MNFNKEVIYTLFGFESYRSKYQLCDAKNGFFKPFDGIRDIQQQIKTTLVAPVIVLDCLYAIPSLIKSVAICLIGAVCLDYDLFTRGMTDLLLSVMITIVIPVVATVVTLASAVSLFTRTFGTICPSVGELCDIPTNALLGIMPKRDALLYQIRTMPRQSF